MGGEYSNERGLDQAVTQDGCHTGHGIKTQCLPRDKEAAVYYSERGSGGALGQR